MSEPLQSRHAQDAPENGDAEVIDALPVLARAPRLVPLQPVAAEPGRPGSLVVPAVQAAAVAAGSFVAGAAVVGLVSRRHRRSAAVAKRRRRGRSQGGRTVSAGGELLQIVSSRSLLVDVHLLGPADGDR